SLSATNPGHDPILSWAVNWGDGSTNIVPGSATSATHVYASASTRTINATARDDDRVFSAASTVQVSVGAQLSAPTGLTWTLLSATQARLSWTDTSSNELGFEVQHSADGINFTQYALVGAGVITCPVFVAGSNLYYDYRIRAYNAAGNSPYTYA